MLNRASGKYHFVSASLFCGVGTGVDGRRILDAGYSILDTRYWMLRPNIEY
jgi:hypothetical protein